MDAENYQNLNDGKNAAQGQEVPAGPPPGKKSRASLPLKLLAAVLVLLALIILGAVLYRQYNVLGSVGNYEVTRGEVSELAQIRPDLPRDELVTTLLDLNLYRQIAGSLGMPPIGQAELDAEYNARTGEAGQGLSYEKYLRLQIELDLLKKNLAVRLPGYAFGNLIIVNFSQHFLTFGEADLGPGETEAQRAELIAQDRKVADDFIKDIYASLKSGGLDFELAMEQQKLHPKVGERTNPTILHSGPFNTNDNRLDSYGTVQNEQVKTIIGGLNEGEISEPKIISTVSAERGGGEPKETFWVIVQLQEKYDKITDNIEEYVESKKQELGYHKK